ncbi:DUF2818 family protein [Variovorax boronicumulans]|uniref:DUF2818 domain-containing protein n=1 Tax=Variovorax boronicumulans TaxID=436515 RepID=A0A250DMX6_9BURK|nr:DUF2818 family protein [Variovorax boronicumulans]ATA55725.1 hypothetical protein CKY39_22725 [Variovorax boronicumulans]MDP9908791.1 hypothetical protein [Variovorax boronicumulans]
MSQTASVWVVLLVALVAANLPFLNERLFGAVPLSTGHKSLAIRFGELVVLYFIAGGIGLLFERRAGQIAAQGWEFYAVTASLFVVLAFPGFTWRYLMKHRH